MQRKKKQLNKLQSVITQETNPERKKRNNNNNEKKKSANETENAKRISFSFFFISSLHILCAY